MPDELRTFRDAVTAVTGGGSGIRADLARELAILAAGGAQAREEASPR